MASDNQLGAFGRVGLFKDRAATTAPQATDDATRGYTVGSTWIKTTAPQGVYTCVDATANAAVWTAINQPGANAIAALIGANMNATTDQGFVFRGPLATPFAVSMIVAINASTSLTTAAGGVYTAASKGGTPIVAAGQVYTAMTTAAVALRLTIAAAGLLIAPQSPIFLSLTTPQGAPATADFYIYGNYIQ